MKMSNENSLGEDDVFKWNWRWGWSDEYDEDGEEIDEDERIKWTA
jgi:hypothetical protein